MAENIRSSNTVRISPGPYLAKVVNHLDTTYMGGLEVTVLTAIPGLSSTESANVTVRYCSPFFGSTSVKFEGNDSSKFDDVQKSYGMWMVPPDIGCTVMVMFVDGDINQGYWFGCIPDLYQNHMVPGIAASQYSAITPEQEQKYGTKLLPVAEYHKGSRGMQFPKPDTFTKPIHPFADRLLQQGLLLDTVRGVTSSTGRREVPSQVFGISTPGPVDVSINAPRKNIGFDNSSQVKIPVSRLGGTQFVMDDGDQEGKNELVRIRTRTGHQILLHNSSDLIYIGNSKGSAWIELTSNGKIDIYAEDSISMHTEGDFNLRADRDFNIEAARNFNVNTINGAMNVNIKTEINTICDTMKTQVTGDHDLTIGGTTKTHVTGDIHIKSDGTMYTTVAKNINVQSDGYFENTTTKNMDAGTYNETVGTSHYRWQGDRYTFVGANTYSRHNSGTDHGCPSDPSRRGSQACPTVDPASPATAAVNSVEPIPLNLFQVPSRASAQGWSNGQFYKASDLLTIMQRVPMHEPWDQHENVNPDQFTLDKTDTTVQGTTTAVNGATIPGGASASTPYPAKNGPASDRGTVQSQPFAWTTDEPFIAKVKDVAGALGFPVIDLLACMNLESARTFDPAIQNNLGFTGLIQFGKPAAASLGTTTDVLKMMTRVQQMDYVQAYFSKLWGWPNSKCPSPTLGNIYLTILLPAFRFAAADQQIAVAGDPKSGSWYSANKGFDPQRLGYFTPAMVEATVAQHKREVEQCLAKAGVTL